MPNNPMRRAFRNHEGKQVRKWMHYLDVYHRHLARFRGEALTLVEFGVDQGGSLELWREYFGPQVRLIGIDIDERCRQFDEPGTTIMIGDQADRAFLAEVAAEAGPIHALIDDGGHHMHQQIATFEELYPTLVDDGVYLVEDVHTSYFPAYSGGYRREGTFMEYAKGLSDQLNAWHSREPGLQVDDFTRTTASMHFYDSVVVFERGVRTPPRSRSHGTPVFERVGNARRHGRGAAT